MQLHLLLRSVLLGCAYSSYFLFAAIGNGLLRKPAQAQQVTSDLSVEAQAATKAPLSLLEEFVNNQNQELIVIYDDTKIQQEPSNLRRQKFISQDNPQILAFKVAQYAKRKQQILS